MLQSPLENHHLAASTRIFLQPEYQFLGVGPLPLLTSGHQDLQKPVIHSSVCDFPRCTVLLESTNANVWLWLVMFLIMASLLSHTNMLQT